MPTVHESTVAAGCSSHLSSHKNAEACEVQKRVPCRHELSQIGTVWKAPLENETFWRKEMGRGVEGDFRGWRGPVWVEMSTPVLRIAWGNKGLFEGNCAGKYKAE